MGQHTMPTVGKSADRPTMGNESIDIVWRLFVVEGGKGRKEALKESFFCHPCAKGPTQIRKHHTRLATIPERNQTSPKTELTGQFVSCGRSLSMGN
jgi:hypothetical protein